MKQSTALEIMKSGKNVFLSGQAGCYDKDTEYLTPSGWKNFSDYVDGDKVAQFSTLTEEVTFVLPQDYIKVPCDKLTRVVTDDLDMCLSDEHRVLFYTEDSPVPFSTEYSQYIVSHSYKSSPSTYIKTNFKYKSGSNRIENEDITSLLDTILKPDTIFDPTLVYQLFKEKQLSAMSEYLENKYLSDNGELVLPKANYKDKVDFIQFILTTGGNSYTFTTSTKGNNCIIKFTLINSYSEVNHKNFKPKEYKPKDGYKYCFTVDTGFLLVRRNNKIFISGNSGKSYTLNKFIEHLRINNIPAGITASTGIASTLVNGSTIHAFASIGIKDTLTASDIHQIRMRKPIADRIRNVKVLIIDEISMLHYKQFEMVDYVFKSIRNDYRPFGGVQIIVAGDFCLKVGTRIIMADGTLRNIEDIIIGDYVMGPDGKPREVLKLFKGTAPLYEVNQTNGMTYTTTGNHLLALKRKEGKTSYSHLGELTTIRTKDYLQSSSDFKDTFVGYKSGPSLLIDTTSTLSVKQVESGEFAGIEVDGDNLFLLEDCTVLHNCQLPPVGNEDASKRFPFMSRAWVQAEFQACYLTEQHRQTVSDLNHVLNSIRNDVVDDNVYSILDSRVINSNTIEDSESTKLFTHNMSVDSFNNKKLDQLDGEERLYKAKTTGTEANIKSLLTNILSPPELLLKVGSRVMFTKNDAAGDYVNGTIGIIEKLATKHVVIKTLDGTQLHVESQEWIKEDMYGSVIATYNQLPLKLSWAVTIHKCIHPDTLVNIGTKGWTPIKDIEPAGIILTSNKTYNKYGNKVSNPVRDGIEIETKYGFKVSVTTDHECKAECAYAPYYYIEAKDLHLEDRLLMLSSVFDYNTFDTLSMYRLSNPAYYALMQHIKAQVIADNGLKHVPRDIIPPSSLQELQLKALSNGILLDLSNPNSLNIPYSFILSNNPLFLPITSLKPIQLESMCVTVEETGSFIQNGFDMSNCQGMTLDAAVIDLRSTFEYGQGYVALSRVKDIEGLQLLGYNPTALELHPLARKADARFKELSEQLEEEFLS